MTIKNASNALRRYNEFERKRIRRVEIMSWEEVEGKTSDEGKVNYVKFVEGKPTVMRIMDEAPISKWRHWIQSANRSVTCCGRDCPVCASIKTAKDAGIQPAFSSVMRHTLHIINKTTGELELLEQGKTFFDQLLALKNNAGDLRDYDIKVIRSGKEKKTTYTVIPMQPSGLSTEELALYRANQVDINDLVVAYTVEQTRGFMEGKSIEEIFKKEDSVSEDLTLVDGDIPY